MTALQRLILAAVLAVVGLSRPEPRRGKGRKRRGRRRHDGPAVGSVEFTIGAGNVPNKGRRFKRNADQARALAEVMLRAGIDVCSVAESYTGLRRAFRDMRAWRVTSARPNTVLSWGSIGNALVARAGLERVGKASVRVRYSRSFRGLNIAIATYQRAGARLTVGAGHLPIRSDVRSEAEWTAQARGFADAVVASAARHHAQGAVISWDTNRDAGTVGRALGAGWRLLAVDEVMQVWGFGSCHEVSDGTATRGYGGVISDHDGLPFATVAVDPAAAPIKARRVPAGGKR